KKTNNDETRILQHSSKAKLNKCTQRIRKIQNKTYKLEKDIAVLNIQKEALQQESLRTVSDTTVKEEELTEFNRAVAELEARVDIQQNQYDARSEERRVGKRVDVGGGRRRGERR